MRRTSTSLAVAAAALLLAGDLLAQKISSEQFSRRVPLAFDGSLLVENPTGWIEIVGTEQPVLEVVATKTVRGRNDAAIKEGKQETQLTMGSNGKNLAVRTIVPSRGAARTWSSTVDLAIRVPRTVHLTVLSHSGERIRVSNISGNVRVKNFSGPITISGVSGPTRVDSVNGSILVNHGAAPRGNSEYVSVNGSIELRIPPESNFEWIAETLEAEIFTTVPLRASFVQKEGKAFRGTVNRPGGPTIQTMSVTGQIFLVGGDVPRTAARSLSAPQHAQMVAAATSDQTRAALRSMVGRELIRPPTASRFALQQNDFNGDFDFRTDLGNVFVGEIRGNANVMTKAGEITLGTVLGRCEVISYGGPLNLGDIFGLLIARTSAGGVRVNAARKGGTLSTEGGSIEVIFAGGPIRLYSGGGDIILRQALDDVRAETKSGDITILFQPGVKSAKVEASSVGGNVLVNLPLGFAADIDALVITTDSEATPIHSDIPGLSFVRERVGQRTHVRATGKINGGGRKLELRSDGGDIHIRTRPIPRIILAEPRQ